MPFTPTYLLGVYKHKTLTDQQFIKIIFIYFSLYYFKLLDNGLKVPKHVD
jgi:hypothetical protein